MTQPEMFPDMVRRPTFNDKAVRASAIDAMIAELREWDSTMDDAGEEIAREILANSMHENGFELAKEFDRKGWSVDAELVAVLDGMDSCVFQALHSAVYEWVEATGARPTLAIGTAVITPDEKAADGEITKIDEREGTYTVCVPSLGHVREGLGTHGFIYAWDRLEAANASPATASTT